MTTFDIVVTTVFDPAWLPGYLENIRSNGHDDSVTIRIICDRKTPASVYEAASEAARAGFSIDCPDLGEQVRFLERIGLSPDFIPWNSDNRRNIGFLRAWEQGGDIVISIDDDNYCRSDTDFLSSHATVGRRFAAGEAREASGGEWFNICSLLHAGLDAPLFPRGYPYAARGEEYQARLSELSAETGSRSVAVNTGLWLDDPDVDAITRLALAPKVDRADAGAVVLAPGTWTPINTQNTAVSREALASFYYVRMGYALQGMRIDRFGDIWSGYLLERCAQQLGEVVSVGPPVAEHRRTPHNLFNDLYHELAGIVLTEELLPWLRELTLTSTSYRDAYCEIAEALGSAASRFRGFVWDEGGTDFLVDTSACMSTWARALKVLMGS